MDRPPSHHALARTPTGFDRGGLLRSRADAEELLDIGHLSPADVEANLADLARMNRLPGGRGASLAAARRLVGAEGDRTIVDVGTGRADIARAFARRGWRVTAVDRHPEVLRIARQVARSVPRLVVTDADARSLPFADGQFDVAHASLLLHHFGPDEAVVLLREMARVSRHGVVVNDLRRGPWALAVTWLTAAALSRSRVTRADALTSARRAYTVEELDALLGAAGLRVRWRSPAFLPRVVTAASR